MASSDRTQLLLFLDWDETVSAHDTLSLIAPPEGEQGRGAGFGSYGEAYVEDLKRHSERWRESKAGGKGSCGGPRTDLGERWAGQWAYLVSLDEVELASQRRIEEGGLFDGFDPEAMEQRAKERVTLRAGWRAFERAMLRKERGVVDEWHIISVGWSARFIAAALRQSSKHDDDDDDDGEGEQHGVEDCARPDSINANEVELTPSTGRGTGRLTKSIDAQTKETHVGRWGIRTAEHKVREMQRILAAKQGENGIVSVYAGDSPTDLGCMVQAHVGIVMGGKEGMQNAIQEAGLNKYYLSHLTKDALHNVQQHVQRASKAGVQPISPLLLAAKDWSEAQSIVQAIHRALRD